jgi:excisionase family DNA binding protein
MDPVEFQKLMKRRRPLTIKEAAELLGVHQNFLYLRMGTHRGPPAHKRGSVWRIPAYDFAIWMQRPETP